MKNNTPAVLVVVGIAIVSVAGVVFFVLSQGSADTVSERALPRQSVERSYEQDEEPGLTSKSLRIGDTGQDKCYDASDQIACPEAGEDFFGQDSQYLGNAPSFRGNGDGTVTDLNTGFLWTQDVYGKYDYDAIPEVVVAGHDDWRIPTIKELYTLMDFRGVDPMSMDAVNSGVIPFIDRNVFDFEYGDTSAGDRIIDSQWATTSIYVADVMGGEECFFGVNFADGRIKCYPTKKGKGYYVRYVRGEIADNDFVSEGGGTVTDRATGLMWAKNDNGAGIDWGAALSYCENLALGGYSDWRLPDIKELQFIVDYSRSPDTTGSAAIDPIFDVSSITNEAGERDYPFFWSSTTHLSEGGAQHAAYISFGRALGYMNGRWMDVHGAGAQRSDPKTGSADDYPTGMGPQGDARRSENYARCVRGGSELIDVVSEAKTFQTKPPAPTSPDTEERPKPPQEAISVCNGMREGSSCSVNTPKGMISGTCRTISGEIACVP